MVNKSIIALLFIQALSLSVSAQTANKDSIAIDSIMHNLPEVMVSGERPMVKVNGNALIYDIKRITRNKPVDNIYEALKELPGVIEIGGKLTLGGQDVTVIVDGNKTNLTQEQLAQALRSIQTNRLENVEVMYNAPAQYNVRGACININFTHETAEQQKKTGEIYGMYDQSHDAAFQERASMVYTGKKLSVDFIYSHNHGNSFNTINSDSHHSLNDGNTYNIATYQREHTRGHNHQIRLSLGYNFTKRHNVNLTYYGAYATSHKRQNTNGSISSDYKLNSEPWTHDISLDYKLPSDTKIGVEYTYYDAPQTQYQNSIMGSRTLNYTSDSRQRLDIWNMYIKQEHALKNGWGLNYGINYKTSKDNSYQAYFKVDNESATLPENTNGHKRENIINIFTGLNKNFNNKIIINASIAAEYYNDTFWNKWNFLPTINTTLIPAQGHILQFSFSSYSTYPEYWAVQNFTRYNNGGYGVITGNPELKPMHEYSTQLTYIIKNKYVLRGWFIYVNSPFMQTLYQNPNELIENIRVLNFDMHQQAGIMASLPLKSGKWYSYVINTTLDCNLNCWYCYEYKIKGSHLQPEVCEAIKKNIALRYKTHPFKTLKMSFFGGEPFLCYKGVKELLDYSKAFCENNDIELIADFTTNATLVSSKRIEYLKQFRCHFQITLDGWKENHNRIKVNNGAKIDAYSKTVEALRLINENIENRWIAVRINFDNNTLEYIDKIIDDINFLDRSKTYVILKKVWQMDTDKVNKNLLIEAIQKLLDNKFIVDYYIMPKGCVCFAERESQVLFNYDGKIFKCTTISSFNDENALGTLNLSNGEITWNNDKTRKWYEDMQPTYCKECKWFPSCLGICNKQIMAHANEKICTFDAFNLNEKEYLMYLFKVQLLQKELNDEFGLKD